MPHISANPQHEAELAATFSARRMSTIHPTMERDSTSQKYSKPSCPVQPKPNLVLCTSTLARQFPCDNFSKRWATYNHRHPSKPTIALHMASSLTTFSHAIPKRWTCDFTGSVVVTHRASFAITGVQDPTTKPTTGPSTIVRHITLRNAPLY